MLTGLSLLFDSVYTVCLAIHSNPGRKYLQLPRTRSVTNAQVGKLHLYKDLQEPVPYVDPQQAEQAEQSRASLPCHVEVKSYEYEYEHSMIPPSFHSSERKAKQSYLAWPDTIHLISSHPAHPFIPSSPTLPSLAYRIPPISIGAGTQLISLHPLFLEPTH